MLAFSYEKPEHPDDPDVCGADFELWWGLGFAEVSE
jgi:hypothetical protein